MTAEPPPTTARYNPVTHRIIPVDFTPSSSTNTSSEGGPGFINLFATMNPGRIEGSTLTPDYIFPVGHIGIDNLEELRQLTQSQFSRRSDNTEIVKPALETWKMKNLSQEIEKRKNPSHEIVKRKNSSQEMEKRKNLSYKMENRTNSDSENKIKALQLLVQQSIQESIRGNKAKSNKGKINNRQEPSVNKFSDTSNQLQPNKKIPSLSETETLTVPKLRFDDDTSSPSILSFLAEYGLGNFEKTRSIETQFLEPANPPIFNHDVEQNKQAGLFNEPQTNGFLFSSNPGKYPETNFQVVPNNNPNIGLNLVKPRNLNDIHFQTNPQMFDNNYKLQVEKPENFIPSEPEFKRTPPEYLPFLPGASGDLTASFSDLISGEPKSGFSEYSFDGIVDTRQPEGSWPGFDGITSRIDRMNPGHLETWESGGLAPGFQVTTDGSRNRQLQAPQGARYIYTYVN